VQRRLAFPLLLAGVLAACGTAPPRVREPVGGRLTPDAASDVAVHALGLVGTPYRYGGNTPDGGFDCSGLIGYVYRNGMTPVQTPRTVAQLAAWGAEVDREALRTGDLVVFGSRATHAGIYVGEGRFVHAPSTGGTVRLDRLDGIYWARQPVAFRRP
jgi:cell wall-associated NlpC family hydrolase